MNKIVGFGIAGALLFPLMGWCSADKFVESSDYKDKEFRKCIISDYTNMTKGDDINWVWKNPDIKLSTYKLSLGKVNNKSEKEKNSETKAVSEAFGKVISDIATSGKSANLSTDVCIYEVQQMSYGKAWIPFVGGHEMQAGVGIEVVLRDKKNQTVASFRHFAREGARIEDAAKETAEDITNFIEKN